MFKRWAAYGFVLALCALVPNLAGGQAVQPKKAAGGFIRNYPNPFNPETTITFTVGDESCSNAVTQHVVTIQILNSLGQQVAIPKLQGTKSGLAVPGQVGRLVQNLKLPCGSYDAFWDGKDQHTRHEVASGIYNSILTIDGKYIGRLAMTVGK